MTSLPFLVVVVVYAQRYNNRGACLQFHSNSRKYSTSFRSCRSRHDVCRIPVTISSSDVLNHFVVASYVVHNEEVWDWDGGNPVSLIRPGGGYYGVCHSSIVLFSTTYDLFPFLSSSSLAPPPLSMHLAGRKHPNQHRCVAATTS